MDKPENNEQSDIQALEGMGFTGLQIKVIEALSDPEDGRMQMEIAADYKIHPDSITRWKRDVDFMDAVNDRLDRKRKHARPTIWKQMVRRAGTTSHQDTRTYMEAVGDIRQKSDVSGDIKIQIDWGPDRPKEKDES